MLGFWQPQDTPWCNGKAGAECPTGVKKPLSEHVNDSETLRFISLESRRRVWSGSREPRSAAD